MNKEEIRKELIRGVYGPPSEWWRACHNAALNGWTEKEIRSILFWYHPITWIVAGFATLTLGVYTYALVVWWLG